MVGWAAVTQQRQGERERMAVRGRALEYALDGDGVDDAARKQLSEHQNDVA